MVKKIKKIVSIIMLSFVSTGMIFANYPVIDISNLMNGINQLYSTYDQINAAIEQVQNTYQQLKTQIESVKNINWDDMASSFSAENWSSADGIAGAWENIGKLRKNMKDTTSKLNSNLNRINSVKHTLENKTVTFGGKQYSTAGLFGIGKYGKNTLFDLPMDLWDYTKATASEAAKGYAGKLTYKQKEKIMQQWGLDPENYAMVKLVEEQANNGLTALITNGSDEYYKQAIDAMIEENKAIEAMKTKSGESLVAGMSVTTETLLQLKGWLSELSLGFNQYGASWAKNEAAKQALKKAKEDAAYVEREKDKLEWMKYLGEIPDWL